MSTGEYNPLLTNPTALVPVFALPGAAWSPKESAEFKVFHRNESGESGSPPPLVASCLQHCAKLIPALLLQETPPRRTQLGISLLAAALRSARSIASVKRILSRAIASVIPRIMIWHPESSHRSSPRGQACPCWSTSRSWLCTLCTTARTSRSSAAWCRIRSAPLARGDASRTRSAWNLGHSRSSSELSRAVDGEQSNVNMVSLRVQLQQR